jgi:hypothetical protein
VASAGDERRRRLAAYKVQTSFEIKIQKMFIILYPEGTLQAALIASIRSVQGIPDHIDTDKLPTSYESAMSRPDAQEWAEVHQKEYCGFKDRNALAIALLPKGARPG